MFTILRKNALFVTRTKLTAKLTSCHAEVIPYAVDAYSSQWADMLMQ